MKKKVSLPKDEFPHSGQAIEWWYFNGFLKGEKNEYSFMTCLFKADRDKANLPVFKLIPSKTIYFSHTLLYNLTKKTVEKEILPLVILSKDSFSEKELLIDYAYLLRKQFFNYEISRKDNKLHLKTKFFDIIGEETKKPLLEGGSGYIDFGKKSTYYYSYPQIKVNGYVKGEKVEGLAWHDKQWSKQGFMKDYWLWFSMQLPDNLDIMCCDYKGSKMATISYKNNKQETVPVEFTPIGKPWLSKKTKLPYSLAWKIKIKDMVIETKPLITDCEMNPGFMKYWEGPVELKFHDKKSYGFMEIVPKQQSVSEEIGQFIHKSLHETIHLLKHPKEFFKKRKIIA